MNTATVQFAHKGQVLFTGHTMRDQRGHFYQVVAVDDGRTIAVLGTRMASQAKAEAEMRSLMSECWSCVPASRQTIKALGAA